MTTKHTQSWLYLSFSCGLALCLLGLIVLSLSGCQVMAQEQASLPRQIALIQNLRQWGYPSEITIQPNGLVYALADTGAIVVLDGPRLVKVIPWPDNSWGADLHTSHIAIHPNNGHLYVTDQAGMVYVISGTTVITTIRGVEFIPQTITIHPHTGLIYVANAANRRIHQEPTLRSTVTVISGTRVLTDLLVGYVPSVLASNLVDGRVYVGQTTGSSFSKQELVGMLGVIEGETVITNTSLGPLREVDSIGDIAIDQRTGEMYLIQNIFPLLYWDGQQSEAVRIPIDLTETGGGGLNHVVVDSKQHLAYASYWGERGSMVIVAHQDKVLAQLPVGEDPRHLAVDTVRDLVYVANRLAGTMSVIRGAEVITTLRTGGVGPTDIAVDAQRGYIYVSNADSHSIAVFGFDEPAPVAWPTWLPLIRR